MSRFILGDCVRVMATIPDNAIDFILTDPPYLVGFRDRSGRTIAGDVNDDWLQPASNEMYRVLKKDALMVSFYGWNRIDRFMAAWKRAGFSVVGHLVFTKSYTPGPSFPSAVIFRSFTRSDFAVSPSNSRQPCASGCGFPCALCIPALSPGFYGGTAPPGVAEYVNNGGKHHAICETCHSEC